MVYIGQTCRLQQRIWEHQRLDPREDSVFHRAIEEFGFDNFEWEVIDKTDSKEESHRLEKLYIDKYDSYNHGYNMTEGGMSWSRWNKHAIVCLDLEGNYIKTYESAAEAERLDGFNNTSVLLCCKGELRSCGKHQFMFEDDYQKYGSKKYIKPKPNGIKPIIQCDTDGKMVNRFDSVKGASLATGIGRARISSALTGCCKTAGDFIWVYENDFPIKDIKKYEKNKKGTKVAQINKETNEMIAVYDSIAEAGRVLDKDYKVIHRVVDKSNRTAYGFKWITIS